MNLQKVEVIKKPREIISSTSNGRKNGNSELKKPAEVIKKLVDDWDDDEEENDENSTPNDIPGLTSDTKDGVNTTVPDETNPVDINSVSDSLRPSVDKSDDLDEDQIVADVDDILNDTDNIMNDVDSILSGKSFKRKRNVSSDKPFLTDIPNTEDDSIIKTLVDKKRPTVQCEECYECFEDQEKLAWHALNDH